MTRLRPTDRRRWSSGQHGAGVAAVEDAGPGFTAEMLAQVGKPYSSSKGRPGGGLGLFLVVNVVRKLGGNVSVRNRETRGAEVVITLPLERLAIGETADV